MSQAHAHKPNGVANIVLVHGGFVDGSGWEGVYKALRKDGYTVGVVQNPTITLADDVAVTKRTIAAQNGPVILVGHSYGGVVVTEAGNDPKVAGLVYVAAFAPDEGESVSSLIANPPPGAPVPPILPPQDGYLFLDRAKFAASFAADVPEDLAAFMADSQVPWGVEALNAAISQPAWRTKPSWYLISTEDKMIPPDAQRSMSKRARSTVVEVKAATPSISRSPEPSLLSLRRPRGAPCPRNRQPSPPSRAGRHRSPRRARNRAENRLDMTRWFGKELTLRHKRVVPAARIPDGSDDLAATVEAVGSR